MLKAWGSYCSWLSSFGIGDVIQPLYHPKCFLVKIRFCTYYLHSLFSYHFRSLQTLTACFTNKAGLAVVAVTSCPYPAVPPSLVTTIYCTSAYCLAAARTPRHADDIGSSHVAGPVRVWGGWCLPPPAGM